MISSDVFINSTSMGSAVIDHSPSSYSRTGFDFALFDSVLVTIKLFDVYGTIRDTLFDATLMRGTYHLEYSFDSTFAEGVYFFHLQAGSYSAAKKVMWLR
jgi:hypothetical protein